MKLANYKLHGRTTFQGLEISIENRKGSVRKWFDPHGKEVGRTTMAADYGYIRGTLGTDGDHVDVYIGPNPNAANAYIVDQMKKIHDSPRGDGKKWDRFDEQKAMLGWNTAAEAKAAYMKQYDDPRFFGSIREMPMSEFISKVRDKKNHGQKIAVSANWIRERVTQGAVHRGIQLSAKEHAGLGRAAVDYAKSKASVPVRSAGLVQADVIPTAMKSIAEARAKLRKTISSVSSVKPGNRGKSPSRHRSWWDSPGIRIAPAVATAAASSLNKSWRETDIENSRETTADAALAVERAAHGATVRLRKEPDAMSSYLAAVGAGAGTGALTARGLGALFSVVTKHPVTISRRALVSHGILGGVVGATGEFMHRNTLKADREARAPLHRTVKYLQKEASSTADRVDDVGIGVLSAPYIASAAGEALEHGTPRMKAIGHALEKSLGVNSTFGKSHAREIAGLALVAPGVTHPVAKKIDQLPAIKLSALEDIARGLYPDYDDYSFDERRAKLSSLMSVGANALRAGRGFVKGVTGKSLPVLAAKTGLIGAAAVGTVGAYKGVNALSHQAREAGTGSLAPEPARGLTRAF